MKLKPIHIAGAIFTIILGSLLHFTFDWSGNDNIVAAFSAVNESTWEHLKLLFVPVLLFMVIEYILYGKDKDNFFTVKLLSILAGLATIVVLFYTYTGIIGDHYLTADIGTFIAGTLVNYLLSYNLFKEDKYLSKKLNWISLVLLLILAALFVLWTFNPPQLGIFVDPVTQNTGI